MTGSEWGGSGGVDEKASDGSRCLLKNSQDLLTVDVEREGKRGIKDNTMGMETKGSILDMFSVRCLSASTLCEVESWTYKFRVQKRGLG